MKKRHIPLFPIAAEYSSTFSFYSHFYVCFFQLLLPLLLLLMIFLESAFIFARSLYLFVVYLLISPFAKFDGMETFFFSLPFALANSSRILNPNCNGNSNSSRSNSKSWTYAKFNKKNIPNAKLRIFFFRFLLLSVILKWKKEIERLKGNV